MGNDDPEIVNTFAEIVSISSQMMIFASSIQAELPAVQKAYYLIISVFCNMQQLLVLNTE